MSTTATTPATKVCTKCGRELSIENYRVHKSGFVLNQCKDCEREASKARAKKSTKTFEVKTSKGVAYTASLNPMPGSRKVTSPNTTKVLYVNADRDTARNLFANWAGVAYTGISATVVE
jgi:ribosome-binding protein aMBF1 (putative translation factor)